MYKSDTGLLTIAALTINDVAGWLVFAVILGFATEGAMQLRRIPFILGATILFAALFLTVGKRLTDRALAKFGAWRLPEPGTSLTFICLLGLLGGTITLKIGIHALFGFFIAGIMAGASASLPQQTRQVITEMVRALLVPLFFVTIGLKLDFLARFDLFLLLFVFLIGTGGRFAGAWTGARLTGEPSAKAHFIAAAHTPGGEMQIVIGILALEYRVITQSVFVAITIAAVLSSIVLGPWLKWARDRIPASEL
jgi:Kef-type K+ transport system membrane component KefB